MTKQYSPEAIKKLAPAFAFLSTANPASLDSIERAAGYAVPLYCSQVLRSIRCRPLSARHRADTRRRDQHEVRHLAPRDGDQGDAGHVRS